MRWPAQEGADFASITRRRSEIADDIPAMIGARQTGERFS
jgi:hypothetical protein